MGTEVTGVLGQLLLGAPETFPALESSEAWNNPGELAVFGTALGAMTAVLEEQGDLEDHLRSHARCLSEMIGGRFPMLPPREGEAMREGQTAVRVLKSYRSARVATAATTARERLSLLANPAAVRERAAAALGRTEQASLEPVLNLPQPYILFKRYLESLRLLEPGVPEEDVPEALYQCIIRRPPLVNVSEALYHLIWGSITEGLPNHLFLHYLKLLAMTEPYIFTEEHRAALKRPGELENVWRILDLGIVNTTFALRRHVGHD